MATAGSFSSDIKWPIGLQPKNAEPNQWPDNLDIYNTLHLLIQAVQSLSDNATSGDSTQTPWQSDPFTRWFYAPVGQDVKAGNIVTPWKTRDSNNDLSQSSGVYMLGAPATILGGDLSGLPGGGWLNVSAGNGFIGFVLADATAGTLCKIGIGPAIANIPGVKCGDVLYCIPFTPFFDPPNPRFPVQRFDNPDGAIYRNNLPGSVVIGAAVADDAAMIFPFVDYFAYNFSQPFLTPSSDNGGGD